MNQQVLSKREVRIAPLEEVLAYQNPSIVRKFMENWDVSESKATELFDEAKKWLWASASSVLRKNRGEEVPTLAVTYSMTLLDEMWHTFILFTREYHRFCNTFFGFYIHHAPTTYDVKEENEQELAGDPEAYKAKVEAQSEVQFSFLYDCLGEETILKWYSEWTDLISPEYLSRIRKAY